MNKEKDFFKTCFNTVAGIEVKNESQAIAKEVVLSEIENLLEENKQLKADLEMYENGVYFSSENDKLQNEIDNLNHIIDKQDKDIIILSKGNKHLKEVIDKAINNSQYWIDYYTRLNSDERIALRLQENIDILKGVKTC